MGCIIKNKDQKRIKSDDIESILDNGLLVNHAYSIISVFEYNTIKFVKLRNPWGQGDWNGN